MKQVLIIADGIVAKHFIHRIADRFQSTNAYTIITPDSDLITQKMPSGITIYHFDPTSYIKLSNILKREFHDIFIVMKNRIDATGTYQNIRKDHPHVRITILDRWDLIDEELFGQDANLIDLNANELLSSRLYDHLPDVPVIAQNVGLGQGEIMEVLVPFGSTYVYRHIGTIIQDQWRIVALYRKNQLLLPKPFLMIKPNDLLLLAGKPSVLESVFRAIKQELGQFPHPFGEHIYLPIDMASKKAMQIKRALEQVQYLQKRMKGRRLIIRILRPTDPGLLAQIKALDGAQIECVVDYNNRLISKVVEEDIRRYTIGLVAIDKTLFSQRRCRSLLYRLKKPVLQLGSSPLHVLRKAVLIFTAEKKMEIISSTVFDIASQLDLDIELFEYLFEGDHEQKEALMRHYENLGTIFSKSLKIRQENHNPIRTLQKEEPFLHILPFSKKLLQNRLLALLGSDVEKLSYHLADNPQLFVPVESE